MGHCLKLIALLVASGLMSAAVAADSDSDKLQGTWNPTSAINDGKKVEEPTLGTFIFSGDTFAMKGKRTLRGKFKVDSSRTPKQIDLNFDGENGSVVPSKAIYRIDGNTLTLCEADFGKPRPSEFTSVSGSKESLIVLVKAENTAPKSAEFQVLNRFVGTWHGKVVLTDANGKKTTTEDEATMRWVLGNSYIEDKIGDALYGLWTYDKDEELYRCWYFMPETHNPAVFAMKWDAEDTSFSGKADLSNGVMMTTIHKFDGHDRFEWSAVVKDASGKILARHEGTKTKK